MSTEDQQGAGFTVDVETTADGVQVVLGGDLDPWRVLFCFSASQMR